MLNAKKKKKSLYNTRMLYHQKGNCKRLSYEILDLWVHKRTKVDEWKIELKNIDQAYGSFGL